MYYICNIYVLYMYYAGTIYCNILLYVDVKKRPHTAICCKTWCLILIAVIWIAAIKIMSKI